MDCGAETLPRNEERSAASSYLPEAFAEDPDRLARFEREAQVLASLNHTNIFTPEGYVELDRTTLIEPTSRSGYGPQRRFARPVSWAHPAYANRHIVQRNDKEIVRASLAASDYQ